MVLETARNICGEAASMRFCVGLHSSLCRLYDACKAEGEMATVELMISQLSVPLMLCFLLFRSLVETREVFASLGAN